MLSNVILNVLRCFTLRSLGDLGDINHLQIWLLTGETWKSQALGRWLTVMFVMFVDSLNPWEIPQHHDSTQTGWCFGCHFLFSHDYWECHHPNWRSHIFQRGGQKPATSKKMSPIFRQSHRWWFPWFSGDPSLAGWFLIIFVGLHRENIPNLMEDLGVAPCQESPMTHWDVFWSCKPLPGRIFWWLKKQDAGVGGFIQGAGLRIGCGTLNSYGSEHLHTPFEHTLAFARFNHSWWFLPSFTLFL